jgi:hypothetical protein
VNDKETPACASTPTMATTTSIDPVVWGYNIPIMRYKYRNFNWLLGVRFHDFPSNCALKSP